MAQLSKSSFEIKYNDSGTGLFKNNTSKDIGADDARTLVDDLTDSFLSISDNFIDEDSFVSDDATKVPSQQSVKAYIDNILTDSFWETGGTTTLVSSNVIAAAGFDITLDNVDAFTVNAAAGGINLSTLGGDLTALIGSNIILSGGTVAISANDPGSSVQINSPSSGVTVSDTTIDIISAGAMSHVSSGDMTFVSASTFDIRITSGDDVKITANDLLELVSTAGAITLTPSSFLNINIGSDSTGDIYYRNAGGHFTRLGIGSSNQVLTVASGLPSWVDGLRRAAVTISAATFRSIGSSPVTLVSAPGANKYINPAFVTLSLGPGSTPYDFSSGHIKILCNSNGDFFRLHTGLIDTNFSFPMKFGVFTNAVDGFGSDLLVNTALRITTTDGSDATTGNRDVTVTVYYTIESM